MKTFLQTLPPGEIIDFFLSTDMSTNICFFSSAETVLTSLTLERTLHLLDDRSGNKKYLRYWIENPNKVLTVILIGNYISNILATALVTLIASLSLKARPLSTQLVS